MKKIVITYGIIAGLIIGGLMMVTMPLFENGTLNQDNGMLIGYTGMVIALSFVFVGIKSFRDQLAGGSITFSKGILIGMAITMIASLFYAGTWEILYARSGEKYIQHWTDHELKNLQARGATDADLQEARDKWKDFSVMYKNPLIRFGMTLMEIFPVGLLISLISAALLRKKEFLRSLSN